MSFLYPTYLWALLGVMIPIVIHFWGKREGRTIKVGSTKLLNESDSKQSRSIQLNELLLLLLRIVLIGVLVLLISGVQFKQKTNFTPVTYLVEPSLVKDDRMASILDSIEEGESLRLLKTDFPLLDKDQLDIDQLSVPNYWKLAREMEMLPTDSIVVFTKASIAGMKGARPIINKTINWIPIDINISNEHVLSALVKEDTSEIVRLNSNKYQLTFNKERVSTKKLELTNTEDSVIFSKKGTRQIIPITSFVPKKVALVYEDSLSDQKNLIVSSLKAISKYINKTIAVKEFTNTNINDMTGFDLAIWLSNDPLPNTSTKILVYKPDEFAKHSIEPSNSNELFFLTESLNVETILTKNVSEQILELLGYHKEFTKDIRKYDKRSIDVSEIQPLALNKNVKKKQFELLDISKWLWLLFGTILIAERGIAKYRKQ
ncbi:BatA domain-containing protein [Aquimarina litoralis]|uniref:BatA domain-containing protein n=1 Tax=Aquimarina litoralis TaxID=584605 RepID=UPI001C569F6D|nr:BatA domain-containing protein [Aquimarina litoralis]MBW1299051.1 hypothetical protein [Aquimarina litoralis]